MRGAVRPIRQWQTEDYYRMMDERQQSSSSRHRVCDLSIRGEAIATPARPQSALPSGYNARTGEVDIEAVYQACSSKTSGTTRMRSRTSKTTNVQWTCHDSSPECRRGHWDFDPFLKDDTGRMISTRTPVAKMTAPISMMKRPRVEVAASRQQHASRSNKSVSSGKSKSDKEVAASKQHSDRLDENNSSNKSKTPMTELTTPASVVRVRRVDVACESRKNSSSEKFKDDKEVAASKQHANRLDANNSSNKAKLATRTSVARAPKAEGAVSKQRVSKLEKNKSVDESKGDKDETEDKLYLPKSDLERALTESTFLPGEKRRRSSSLQVLSLT